MCRIICVIGVRSNAVWQLLFLLLHCCLAPNLHIEIWANVLFFHLLIMLWPFIRSSVNSYVVYLFLILATSQGRFSAGLYLRDVGDHGEGLFWASICGLCQTEGEYAAEGTACHHYVVGIYKHMHRTTKCIADLTLASLFLRLTCLSPQWWYDVPSSCGYCSTGWIWQKRLSSK